MIRLPIVDAQGAKGGVREVYDDIAATGDEPHLLFQCYANDPAILRVEWELEKELMHGDSVLSRKLREYVSITVAMLRECGG
jgi:hypothetical protein